MSTWSAASRRRCARPTTTRSDARASMSTPAPAPRKEAGDIVQPLASGVLKKSQRRGDLHRIVRAARPRAAPSAERDHAVQVGRRGARGSGRRDAGVAGALRAELDGAPKRARTRPPWHSWSKSAVFRPPRRSMSRSRRAPTWWASCSSRPRPAILARTARALGSRVQGRARKVALTVDADDTLLASIIEALSPTCSSFTATRRRSASRRCARASACR